jgi:hypothetical protein
VVAASAIKNAAPTLVRANSVMSDLLSFPRHPFLHRICHHAYLDALAEIHRSCEVNGLDAISVALRWLVHHSQLNAERNDWIIIGA